VDFSATIEIESQVSPFEESLARNTCLILAFSPLAMSEWKGLGFCPLPCAKKGPERRRMTTSPAACGRFCRRPSKGEARGDGEKAG